MAATKKKGKSHLQHAAMERILMGGGGDVFRVWAKASPRQRKILKTRAAKQGVTIAGLIQGGPLALRERSPQGIRQEALRRVGAGFGEAETEINERERRITNLDKARQQDEEAYRNWAMTQQQRLTAASEAATQQLETTLKELTTQAQGLQNDVAPEVAAQLKPEQEHSVMSVLNQRVGAARDRAQGGAASEFLQSNVVASGQARAARRVSETSAALADVNTERKALSKEKRGKVIELIGSLMDTEIGKAQGNREFGAALEKLGIDRAELGADIADDKADNRAKKRDQKLKRIDQQLKSRSLTETERHNLEQERIGLINATNKGDKGTNKFGVENKEAEENRGRFQNMVARLRYGSLSKQTANAHPLLARAAAAWVKGKPLDSHTIRGIQKIYGFTPPVRKSKKRLPPAGDRSPGQRGPGAGTS